MYIKLYIYIYIYAVHAFPGPVALVVPFEAG